jgi:phage gpG-like protein
MGLTGDWAKLERMLAEAGNKLKSNVGKATTRCCKIVKAAVVARIEQQKGFKALSGKYLKRKTADGFSEQILIREGELVKRGIQSKEIDWQSGMVTAKRMVEGGVNIAAVHEFGSPKMKIPARPYMSPGCRDAEPQVIKEYQKAIEDTFK